MMKKELFILNDWMLENYPELLNIFHVYVENSLYKLGMKTINHLAIIGIINIMLEDKANCKDLWAVERHKANEGYGYLVTYVESEMIATKSDLLKCFNEGRDIESLTNFQEWFNENF